MQCDSVNPMFNHWSSNTIRPYLRVHNVNIKGAPASKGIKKIKVITMSSIAPLVISSEIPFITCGRCKVIVLVVEIYAHLHKQHKIKPRKARLIEAKAQAIPGVIQHQDDLRMWNTPPPTNDAVPELGQPASDGLSCDECQFIIRDIKGMQRHFKAHGWVNPRRKGGNGAARSSRPQEVPWRTNVRCQRLGRSRHSNQWFEVERGQDISLTANARTTDDDRIKLYRTIEADMSFASQTQQPIIPIDSKLEASGWLKRVGWTDHLSGHPYKHWLALAKEPQEDEPVLRQMDKSLNRVLDAARRVACPEKMGWFAMAHLMRRDLVSKEPERPMDNYMEDKTWDDYKRRWRKVIWITVRSESAADDERAPYKFTGEQSDAFDAWEDEATAVGDGEPSESEARKMDELCLRTIITMLDHRIKRREYRNVLLSALAVMGVEEDGTWASPFDYTSVYSAIIKVARFAVALNAYKQWRAKIDGIKAAHGDDADFDTEDAEEDAPAVDDIVKVQVERYMVRGGSVGPTPMHWIFGARAYGMKIRFETAAPGTIQWKGEYVTYQRITTSVGLIEGMCHMLVGEAEEALAELTMVDKTDDLPQIPWSRVEDDHSDKRIGHSFLTDERNEEWVAAGKEWVFRRIEASREEKRRWFSRSGGVQGRGFAWRSAQARQYDGRVERFREKLWVLMHMMSGGPARSTEIMSIRMVNTANGGARNVYADRGLLFFVTLYHKGFQRTQAAKTVYRYMPRAIGSLLTWYMWLVLPFWQVVQKEIKAGTVSNPWLWARETVTSSRGGDEGDDEADDEGRGAEEKAWRRTRQVWSGDKVRRVLRQTTERLARSAIGVSAWRQLAVAIANRRLIGTPFETAAEDGAHDEDSGDEYERELAAGMSRSDRAIVASTGHGAHVRGMIYAREMQQGDFGTAMRQNDFRVASVRWHELFGFDGAGGEAVGEKRRAPEPDGFESAAHRARGRRLNGLRSTDLSGALRRMMGTDDVRFRGAQRMTLEKIVGGWPRILQIMGTGQGKSMMFMLPAFCEPAGTTIVVTPLVALRDDMMVRCGKMGIESAIWRDHGCHAKPIVFVTPETAVTKKFGEFINRLQGKHQLDRVVLDECHYILDIDRSFRPRMAVLGQQVNDWRIQVVYLTATLPPTEEEEFFKRMKVSKEELCIIRCPTSRVNIRYRVVAVQGKEAEEESDDEWTRETDDKEAEGENGDRGGQAKEEPLSSVEVRVVKVVRGWLASNGAGKAVVYAPMRDGVDRLGRELGCRTYHSKVGDNAEKKALLEEWVNSGSGQDGLVVATNALGLGVDVPDVRLVVHAGMPQKMRDFVQESGRAGRDGQASESVVVHQAGWADWANGSDRVIEGYLTTAGCRREILDKVMDGVERTGGCRETEELCDNCARAEAVFKLAEGAVEAARKQEFEFMVQLGRQGEEVRAEEENKAELIGREGMGMGLIESQRIVRQGERAREEERQRGLGEVERFQQEVLRWDDFCPWCWEDGHGAEECRGERRESDGGLKMEYMALVVREELFGKRRLERFSGCFQCGLPQVVCHSWRGREEDGGRFESSGRECGRDMILARLWASMWLRDEERCKRWMRREGFRGIGEDEGEEGEEQSWVWMGERVKWGDVETNNMCKVVFQVWRSIQGNKGG